MNRLFLMSVDLKEFASDLFSRMPCKIYIFEPVIEFAKQIEKRFKLTNDKDICIWFVQSN